MEKKDCERLIREYYRELYNYILVRLRYHTQSAEDCTQELFVTFYRKHPDLEAQDNIRLWLYRAADNVILSWLRKNSADTVSLEDSPEAMNTPAPEPARDDYGALAELLTPEELELVRLYYDTDYGSREEAAAKLGITVTALYQRVHKIREKLKKHRCRGS